MNTIPTITAVLDGRASWALIHGDCMDQVAGLPSLPAGLDAHLMGDPPFSEHVHESARTNKRQAKQTGSGGEHDLGFAHLTPGLRRDVCSEAARIGVRWIVLFTDAESLGDWKHDMDAAGARYIRGGVWVRELSMPQVTGDRPGAGTEGLAIGYGRDGTMAWNGGGRPAVWTGPRETGKRVHPTQKPLWLMEALVRDFTDQGDIIIDPFAGSGTTGVACLRLGRRFLGWERNEKHHAAAVRRIASTREQIQLLPEAPRPMKQQAMFSDVNGGIRCGVSDP